MQGDIFDAQSYFVLGNSLDLPIRDYMSDLAYMQGDIRSGAVAMRLKQETADRRKCMASLQGQIWECF